MSRTINFVRERQRNLSKLEEQDRKIFKWAVIGLASILAVTILVVCVRVFMLYKVNRITEEQKSLKQAIAAQEIVEKSFTVFVHKLKTLTDLFGKRKEKQETLAYFSTLFDKDVIIRQLDYTSDSEQLSFVLESKHVFVLEHVLKTMNSDELKTRFPRIEKNGLTRSDGGKYNMSITIPLGDKPIEQVDSNGQPIQDTEEELPISQPGT
ncbi:hypothetical protein KA082_00925 [Candidatus Woesebacteria bacterium]|nr:hypothetical protein [Candidatus Woesebacteria bacterium]